MRNKQMIPYYIDTLPFSIEKKTPFKFDENGVTMSKIPYTNEYHYHVTAIASCAIYFMKDDEEKSNAQLEWLLDNIPHDGGYQHDFVFPFYKDFKKPWVGGLSQGLAISAFVRAYHKYDDKKYLTEAKRAFSGLTKYCIYKDEKQNTWICEYPKVPTILNGFIYALFGVKDICKNTRIKKAKLLWDDCVTTLLENMHKYDLGYCSKYDLVYHYPATKFYHNIHIKQLKVLHNLTTYKQFHDYEKKWKTDYNEWRAKIKKNLMIVRNNGFLETYKKYKVRRDWISK